MLDPLAKNVSKAALKIGECAMKKFESIVLWSLVPPALSEYSDVAVILFLRGAVSVASTGISAQVAIEFGRHVPQLVQDRT